MYCKFFDNPVNPDFGQKNDGQKNGQKNRQTDRSENITSFGGGEVREHKENVYDDYYTVSKRRNEQNVM